MAELRSATARRQDFLPGRAGGHAGEQEAGDPGPSDDPGDVVVRIRSLLPSLAPAEQRVAQLAVSDPGRTARWTISEYAEQAQTSGTTIIRFCRAIGLDGYPALRIALAATAGLGTAGTWRSVTGDIAPDDDITTVVRKVGHADARAIEDTVGQIDHAVLAAVVDAMVTAARIDIYGFGASGLAASDLQHKLHRLGNVVYAWADTHMALTSAALLSARDVALGISYSGTTLDTIECLRVARSNGALAVALTNHPRSPLAETADLVLTTAARETTFRTGEMTSRIAQFTVVDCLFALVAQRNFERTVEALERTCAAIRRRRAAGR